MLSVIIPCASQLDLLIEQLDALCTMTCAEPWEVVVVDNGVSHTEPIAVLDRYADSLPGFRVVDATERRGAGYARNVGVSHSRGDKLAFLDADDVAGDGWLDAMADALDVHDVVASRWDIDRLNDGAVREGRKNGQADGV